MCEGRTCNNFRIYIFLVLDIKKKSERIQLMYQILPFQRFSLAEILVGYYSD
jgi:hypothetical protein